MADEPFVDTHIHFWDKSVDGLRWAWLEPGFSFRKWTFDPVMDAPRYGPDEFRAEAAGSGLVGAVHVNCADPLPVPAMETAWDGVRRLRALGTPAEYALYLLPNAVSIRFTESASLLDLRHKHAMRLCYNAQEEIWRASLDEALQIREVNPRIGPWLLPPCTLRHLAEVRPVCPEGERFCGVVVWKQDQSEYTRAL